MSANRYTGHGVTQYACLGWESRLHNHKRLVLLLTPWIAKRLPRHDCSLRALILNDVEVIRSAVRFAYSTMMMKDHGLLSQTQSVLLRRG